MKFLYILYLLVVRLIKVSYDILVKNDKLLSKSNKKHINHSQCNNKHINHTQCNNKHINHTQCNNSIVNSQAIAIILTNR